MKTQTCILCCTLLLAACAESDGGNNSWQSIEPGVLPLPLITTTPLSPPSLTPAPLDVPAAPPFEPPQILTGLCDTFDEDLHEHEDDIPNWLVYTETGDEFILHYPPGWRVVKYEGWIGFAPQELKEDVQWGLHIFRAQDTSLQEAIQALGSQFGTDRVFRRECFKLGDQIALRVLVVTPIFERWVLVSVFVEHDGWIYQFENGAVPDDRFHYFYCSLRFQ